MLCPEVWKFNTNKNNTIYQTGNYDSKARKALGKTIQNKFFNRMVSIILPGCQTIPEPIQELIKTADYYLVKNLRLCELVRKDFVEAFIKRGRLTAISLQNSVSIENTVYVTPDGKLNILICKDLYQTLGLEGRPFGQSKERFEITIDLKNNNLFQKPKLFNRIKSALSNSEIEQFDFQFTWQSVDPNICPSSIAKYFKDTGYTVEQHSIQTQLARENNLKIPNEAFSKGSLDSATAHQVAEYFAFIMLECDMNSSEELNSYRPRFNLNLDGEPSRECVILHCKGLMSSEFVANLLEALRLSSKSVIFNLNGDQLPAKGNAEQIFVLLNDEKYLLFTT